MNREEIENRIEVCEIRAKGYREVGNTKLADKYENEKYKWEKLLSDLNLLNERKIAELLDYKKGYSNLEQENQELHNKIEKAIELNNTIIKDTKSFYRPTSDTIYSGDTLIDISKQNLEILKGSGVGE